jgi:hypothetical protein
MVVVVTWAWSVSTSSSSWLASQLRDLSVLDTLMTLFFLVLVFITVFRKQLSANDTYRNPTNPNKLPSLPSLPSLPAIPNTLPTLPTLPSLPALPNLSNLPTLPTMPALPTLDTVTQLSLDDCKSALAKSVEVAVEVAKEQLEAAKREGSNAYNKYYSTSSTNPTSSSSSRTSKRVNVFNLVSEDIVLKFVLYMSNAEITRLACCSSPLSKVLLSDSLWEMLWMENYGAMWRSKGIAQIREMRRIVSFTMHT